jgi:hypothetical protein
MDIKVLMLTTLFSMIAAIYHVANRAQPTPATSNNAIAGATESSHQRGDALRPSDG